MKHISNQSIDSVVQSQHHCKHGLVFIFCSFFGGRHTTKRALKGSWSAFLCYFIMSHIMLVLHVPLVLGFLYSFCPLCCFVVLLIPLHCLLLFKPVNTPVFHSRNLCVVARSGMKRVLLLNRRRCMKAVYKKFFCCTWTISETYVYLSNIAFNSLSLW